jgi:hypothetical protein
MILVIAGGVVVLALVVTSAMKRSQDQATPKQSQAKHNRDLETGAREVGEGLGPDEYESDGVDSSSG